MYAPYSPESSGVRFVHILFGVGVSCLSGAVAFGAVSSWDEAEGRVSTSSVEQLPDGWYRPNVTYAYTYEGKSYRGRLVVPDDALGFNDEGHYASDGEDGEEVAAIVDAYRPGATVTVYVNPSIPTQAVLDRSASLSTVGLGAAGVLALGAALVLALRKDR